MQISLSLQTKLLAVAALTATVPVACAARLQPQGSPQPTISTSSPTNIVITPIISPLVAANAATPDLIDQAYQSGHISADVRFLYLVYSMHDYESLPVEFRGKKPWRGTAVVIEITDTIASEAKFCALDLEVRKKVGQLLKGVPNC